jgi:RND family efflux transporter MFP subunit
MKLILQILPLSILLCLAACDNTVKQAPAQEPVHEAHMESVVTLTPEQSRSVGVELGSIEQKNITATVKVSGTLEVPAQNKASVTSLYGGMLRSIHVHPGSAVRKGQVLATLVNTELSGIQQQFISIGASLRLAELEESRQRELVAGNAAPLKNLQRARAELSSLQAQRAALGKQLSDLGISTASLSSGTISSTLSVTAPISGTISDIDAQIGSKVDAETPLARIVNNSQLHLDLFVFEKDLPVIRTGQIIHFTLTNNPGKEYDAKIFSIGTAFANETKAVPVHAEVMGEKTGLIEGMSVTAIVSLNAETAPAVPNDAIVSSGGRHYIFIRSDKAPEAPHSEKDHDEGAHESGAGLAFERIEVARGTSDLGYTVITPVTPLPPNAQIVLKGAFFILARMTNTGEHEH